MRVLLLGAKGQLGTDFSRLAEMRPDIDLINMARADLDLSNLDDVNRVLGDADFDIIVNTTGYINVDEAEMHAQKAVLINGYVPQRLAEICAIKKARFIHLSTDYVFGGQSKREPLTESDAPAPLNVYGTSKLMGESLSLVQGGDVIVCRASSLFGVAGASGKGGNFVETMIRLAKERGELAVVDDQIMAPTATEDLAEAILRLITARVPAGIYHVAGTGQASWYDFAREIMRQAGYSHVTLRPVSTQNMRLPARRPPYSVLSNGKVAQTIGWVMPTWRDALRRYLLVKGYKS